MPKVKSSKRGGNPPEGFSTIEPVLNKLLERLKESQLKSMNSKDQKESLWKIIQLNHQISRYIYTMHYERQLIDKPLYEWLLKQKYCNSELIAKWKKKGYENLCCLNCIKSANTNYGTTCICRVPKATLEKNNDDRDVQCITCGCRGCSSTD